MKERERVSEREREREIVIAMAIVIKRTLNGKPAVYYCDDRIFLFLS